MSTRTSIYGDALKSMPKWVYGGEFGDISTLLNNRDISYQDVAQNEQQTESNNYKLEDLSRAEKYRQKLTDAFKAGVDPKDLRGMYETMISAAGETGNPGDVVKISEALDSLDRQQRKDKTDLIELATKVPYSGIQAVYGDNAPITEADAKSLFKKAKTAKEPAVEVFDLQNNFIRNVPESQAILGQMNGTLIRTDDPRFKRAEDEGGVALPNFPSKGAPSGDVPPEANKQPDFKLFRDSGDGAVQGGRGDRLRDGPSVGDQVDTVIRKRKVIRG